MFTAVGGQPQVNPPHRTRSQVVSICDLQRLALYWFRAPGLQLGNEVSQSTDQPHAWNCLPPALRSPDLVESNFKRALKTHLFSTDRRH